MTLSRYLIAPSRDFLAEVARHIFDFSAGFASPRDLSPLALILPNIKLAPALSQALLQEAGGPVLLPKINTVSGMVEPWLAAFEPLPDVRRQLILHALLRGRAWFDEALLWDVVGELVQLFDVLTEHAVALPDDEAALLTRLEQAFELHASRSLAFEARLVNSLWRAEAQGRPSRLAARILATSRWVAQLDAPLIVLAESEQLGPLQSLIDLASQRVPVLLLQPARNLADNALGEFLSAAWPVSPSLADLRQRVLPLPAASVSEAHTRFRLQSSESFEGLGQAVADQVLDWIRVGKRNIALVACDRLAARRARALLERDKVLVQDETGWKLATTRVAATVDAWLEVLSSDAWHRALIDLLRAPLLFADLDPLQRAQAGEAIAQQILASGTLNGLDRIAALVHDTPHANLLMARLREARSAMASTQSASIAEWLRRLRRSLGILGATTCFEADMAGRMWLEWLETSLLELGEEAEKGERFRFSDWRTWFNRQMDAQLFRDESIESPVIMTHLAATRLRRFEAAIVIGADSEHLAPPHAPGWLTHAGVRRELGLPGLDAEAQQLREDLAGLTLACDETVFAWQSMRRDEMLMPAADVSVLAAALELSGESQAVLRYVPRPVQASTLLAPSVRPAPSIPPSRVPLRLSASGMQSLLDCPYRYFARYVLRLAEVEELSESMEKRDFGEQLHSILNAFHTRFPLLQERADAELIQSLEEMTEEAFREAVQRNFQDHAWRLRWRSRIAAYIAWQREREADGWRWQAGEQAMTREHELGAGRNLLLNGRIDRIDSGPEHSKALLDYKSRALSTLRDQTKDPDDVQLAFYTLLYGARVDEAAYVALDEDKIDAAKLEEPEARAEALQDCITDTFVALYQGAGMPAQGSKRVCAHCEMRGLCRKDWTL